MAATPDPFDALGDPQRREILRLLGEQRAGRARDRRPAADQPARGLPAPAAAQGVGPGRGGAARARGASTGSRRRGCSPSRPTSSRSGVMRPPASGSPRRTCRRRAAREYAGRAAPAEPRGRLRARATPSPSGPSGSRCGGRPTTPSPATPRWSRSSPARRADLRARHRRDRARVGRDHRLGTARSGSATSGTCCATGPTPPTWRSASGAHGSGTRVEIEHRGWERLGADADLLARRATRAAGARCSPTTSHAVEARRQVRRDHD